MRKKNIQKLRHTFNVHNQRQLVQHQKNQIGSMCYIMDTNEIRGSLLLCLCNHPSSNALEHKITINSKANPIGGHGFISKTPIPTCGIQNDSFNVVWGCSHLNLFKNQQNWNSFPILHHICMDVHPLLNINGGHFIYTNSNIVNTWKTNIAFKRTTSCMAFTIYQPLLLD